MEPNEIKELVEASGLKKGELESELGLAQSTLSKVIKGTRSLNAKKLSALKRICNKAIKEMQGPEALEIAKNNLQENKARIEKERNAVNSVETKNPLTPEESFQVPDVNVLAETYTKAPESDTITFSNAFPPVPEVPPVPDVNALAEPPNNPLLSWENIAKQSQEIAELHDLGQRFKTICEAIDKTPDEMLNWIADMYVAPVQTEPVVIAHEDDVREFPRPDSSLFKYL